jgi:hypothetical protein
MTRRLTITAISLVLATSFASPAAAVAAGPLLSGYGGPGQGNQAILGSALLNGGSGGGSSGGRHAGNGTQVARASNGEVSTGTGAGAPAGASAGAAGGAPAAASGARGKHPASPVAGGSSGHAAASADSSSLTASRGGAGGSQTLGLSGADLLYILLAFGVLVFTGLLTRRLARVARPGREAS